MLRERRLFVSSSWFLVTYFGRNRRRLLPIMLVLILSVFAVTITGVLTGSIQAGLSQRAASFQGVIFLLPNWREGTREISTDLQRELATDTRVHSSAMGYVLETYLPNLAGRAPILLIGAEAAFHEELMVRNGLRLTEGRLPAPGAAEVSLPATLLQARGLKVGDSLDPTRDPFEALPERFQIVGALAGERMIGLLPKAYLDESPHLQTRRALLALPIREHQAGLEQELNQLPREQVIPYTYRRELARYRAEAQNMDRIVWLINAIIITVISISVGLLNLIYFMQRRNEIGLFTALGYSRGFLIRRALAESLLPTCLAWVMGLGLSGLAYALLNRFLFTNLPLISPLNWRVVGFTTPIPIAVGLFGALAVIRSLLKLDPVEIIERRD